MSAGELGEQQIPHDVDVLGGVRLAGQPDLRAERTPSFMCPVSERPRSSGWSATGMPNACAYSSARRISPESMTGLPSSVIATAPASTISPTSASRSALTSRRDAPDRVDPGRARGPTRRHHEADRGRIVDRRIGVRHRADGGEATGCRGRGPGRDRLLVLLAGLAQVHVHVDQPRG